MLHTYAVPLPHSHIRFEWTYPLSIIRNCDRRPPRRLVLAACRVLGVTPEQALEAYGTYFISYVTKMVRPASVCLQLPCCALGLAR